MTKRSPTAYNFLTKDTTLRDKIKSEHPEWQHTEIMSEYAKLWKNYTDEQKKPYVEMAKKAKEEFVPTPSVEEGGEEEVQKVVQKKKRAKTAFIFYLYDTSIRDKVKKEHPEFKPKDLTSHISKMWKELTPEDKKPWEDMSNKQKQEYLENPVYEDKIVKNKKPMVSHITQERAHQLENMIGELRKQVEELKELYEKKVGGK